MQSWNTIVQLVLKYPPHQDLKVDKSAVLHPLKEGFVRRIGELQGQIADFGRRLPDGRGVHIREFDDHFLVHWDKVDPSDPIGHLVQDAPHWIGIGALVLIGIVAVGLALSEDSS